MRSYSRAELMQKLDEIVKMIGKMPTQRELRDYGISEDPYYREFGNWSSAKEYYNSNTVEPTTEYAEVSESQPNSTTKSSLVDELVNNLTEAELKTLVQSSRGNKVLCNRIPPHTKATNKFKVLITGDSHIGHSKFREDWWYSMIDRAVEEGVDFMWHTGDILEGMSNRPGHIYELSEVGFEAQFAKAKQLIGDCPFRIRAIIGNHDQWGQMKADQGVNVGMRLQESLPNFVYLGTQESMEVINNIKVLLWHGMDGAAYSISYRTQKFVENLYGGDKPNVLLAGHSHKSIFYETRNVHVFETGTLCQQTGFMRNKKLAAHTGYWIVEFQTNSEGLVRIKPEWNAFY